MKNSLKTLSRLSALSIAVTLTACGGGGGGSSDAGTAATPVVVAEAGNLLTSVPTPTYAAGSANKALFEQLNSIRLAGGFGMMEQDEALDLAAYNHSKYTAVNYIMPVNGVYPYASIMYLIDPATGQMNAHVEKSGALNFTGIMPVDRILVAGAKYATSGEVMAFTKQQNCVSVELNTVFHRSSLLNTNYSKIGIGFFDINSEMNPWGVCTFEPAYKTTAQIQPANWIGVYPGVNQTSVPVGMPIGEAPDPAPEIPNGQKGSPVSIYLESQLGVVSSFTLTKANTNALIPVKVILPKDFPKYMTQKEAHIISTQPLSTASVYNVYFKGVLSNGKAVEKAWSFTTAN